mmetsp:Transcript_96226/g.299773  ORF Transcript_96226/g.299773 Transcript_96226/m.299773 type:complete len:204 (+) Transcript_96226:92-703(+)
MTPRASGARPRAPLAPALAIALAGAAAVALQAAAGPRAFSLGAPARRLELPRVGDAQAPRALGSPEDAEGALVMGAPAAGVMPSASKGLTLILAALSIVALGDTPPRRKRRVWRRLVRGQPGGRTNARKDKRPSLFGPEKPPHEAKRIYHYYCNKMYKVIRESTGGGLDMAPAEAESAGATTWLGVRAIFARVRRALTGTGGQ